MFSSANAVCDIEQALFMTSSGSHYAILDFCSRLQPVSAAFCKYIRLSAPGISYYLFFLFTPLCNCRPLIVRISFKFSLFASWLCDMIPFLGMSRSSVCDCAIKKCGEAIEAFKAGRKRTAD